MLAGVLITIREGLEAFLIVAILLGYLKKIGERHRSWQIWAGAAAAVVTSVAIVAGLSALSLQLSETSASAFEAVASLTAVGVLSWMVLWMQRQSMALKGELESRVDQALSGSQVLALASLAYVTVVREGFETALFLTALSKSAKSGLFTGAVIGLFIAAFTTYMIFRGSVRLNLRKFFIATSIMLILIAAGLMGHAAMALTDIGVFKGSLASAVWNTGAYLPDDGIMAKLLHVFTGYVARPSLAHAGVYAAYIILFGYLYARAVNDTRRKPA